MTDIETIAKGLTEEQRESLLPRAADRSCLPKALTVWRISPTHGFPCLKLSNLGYQVRDYLKGEK